METKPTVLLVEDEGIISLEVEEDLRRFGCSVVDVVRRASEACNRAKELKPDFIIMDVALAAGGDGIKAAQHITKVLPSQVIFLTGRSDEVTRRRMQALAPVAILQKPYDRRALREAILGALPTLPNGERPRVISTSPSARSVG